MQDKNLSNWSVFEGEYNKKPIILRMCLDKETLKKNNFIYRVGIVIPILHPQKDGMPIPEENIVLNAMEEDIIEMAEENNEGAICSVLLTSGIKEMMFYTNKAEPKFLEDAKKKFQNYAFQWYGKEDANYIGLDELAREFGLKDL